MPAVSRYMTPQPWVIPPRASLADAQRLMRDHGIRHLPVVDNGALVGVVSQRDVHLLLTLADVGLDQIKVSEAMTERPFIVTADTSLDEVVEIMANGKYGSAIVLGRNGVEGIFTTIDACRALADVLHRFRAESLGLSSDSLSM